VHLLEHERSELFETVRQVPAAVNGGLNLAEIADFGFSGRDNISGMVMQIHIQKAAKGMALLKRFTKLF
jgi:hypothetical protein